jgi:hypothetical protein
MRQVREVRVAAAATLSLSLLSLSSTYSGTHGLWFDSSFLSLFRNTTVVAALYLHLVHFFVPQPQFVLSTVLACSCQLVVFFHLIERGRESAEDALQSIFEDEFQ